MEKCRFCGGDPQLTTFVDDYNGNQMTMYTHNCASCGFLLMNGLSGGTYNFLYIEDAERHWNWFMKECKIGDLLMEKQSEIKELKNRNKFLTMKVHQTATQQE